MSVYMVRCEGEDRVVEASDFGAAVAVWRVGMVREYPEPGEGWYEAEPDSVELISRDAVIRPPAAPAESEAVALLRRVITADEIGKDGATRLGGPCEKDASWESVLTDARAFLARQPQPEGGEKP